MHKICLQKKTFLFELLICMQIKADNNILKRMFDYSTYSFNFFKLFFVGWSYYLIYSLILNLFYFYWLKCLLGMGTTT